MHTLPIKVSIKKLQSVPLKFEGGFSKNFWSMLFNDLKIPKEYRIKNHASAIIHLTIVNDALQIWGRVELICMRQCARTLQYFLLEETLLIKETLSLQELLDNEDLDLTDRNTFLLEEYLRQQVLLNISAYPTNPEKTADLVKNFNKKEGLPHLPEADQSPFAVLKALQ